MPKRKGGSPKPNLEPKKTFHEKVGDAAITAVISTAVTLLAGFFLPPHPQPQLPPPPPTVIVMPSEPQPSDIERRSRMGASYVKTKASASSPPLKEYWAFLYDKNDKLLGQQSFLADARSFGPLNTVDWNSLLYNAGLATQGTEGTQAPAVDHVVVSYQPHSEEQEYQLKTDKKRFWGAVSTFSGTDQKAIQELLHMTRSLKITPKTDAPPTLAVPPPDGTKQT